jgi:hypothetical protein
MSAGKPASQNEPAIVEKFSDLQDYLDKERKVMNRLWAKREAQIRGVLESTVGMYGDFQGIAGKTLQEVEGLDLRFLEGPPPSADQTSPVDPCNPGQVLRRVAVS